MRLHQAGMGGYDTHAKPIGAAFSGGNTALVNVISIARSRLVGTLMEDGRGRIPDVAIVYFAVIRLYADMLRIDCAQMHARADLQ